MSRTASREVPPERVAFGRALRAARMEAGLTQVAAAQEAGVDRSHYADIEAAKHSASVDVVFRIAKAIGIPAADLFAAVPDQASNATRP